MDSPWNSPGQNTGAFPFSRGSSQPRDQTQVSHIAGGFFSSWATRGSPRVVEWVAYPFSRGSSWPRNWTGVSCTAGGFFTSWATREAPPEGNFGSKDLKEMRGRDKHLLVGRASRRGNCQCKDTEQHVSGLVKDSAGRPVWQEQWVKMWVRSGGWKGIRLSLGLGCHCVDLDFPLKLDGKTWESFEQRKFYHKNYPNY